MHKPDEAVALHESKLLRKEKAGAAGRQLYKYS
jgi:hypothetical protein